MKRYAHRRVVARAGAFTTWSQWAKDSLVADYGARADAIEVYPPGADLELFPFGREPRVAAHGRPLRLLFVGGDLKRKGGDVLAQLVAGPLSGRCELDLVTGADVPSAPGVRVHRNVGPNSSELLALYRAADVFVLPTNADCLAVVLGEAMAAGLPIITTPVGAHGEAVVDGETGLLMGRGDVAALAGHIQRFIAEPRLAIEMGRNARRRAEQLFDARKNAQAIGDLIVRTATRGGRFNEEEQAA
jgi:glycosyltransferase involved in cell wall biosynthesis